ncbi:hypothetical protein DUI87_33506 [Hirundo rustica rustica]|uniref:Uncharacterized protein n=1 Tax=Hirundo rustica rustica TaxID=333673 RepID=A0A3M0IUB4_HIRRU|nr:hypothetical protein DUI87_33506 [Hirundo rustica rustica]
MGITARGDHSRHGFHTLDHHRPGILVHGDCSRLGFPTWITTDLEWDLLHVEATPDMDFTPGSPQTWNGNYCTWRSFQTWISHLDDHRPGRRSLHGEVIPASDFFLGCHKSGMGIMSQPRISYLDDQDLESLHMEVILGLDFLSGSPQTWNHCAWRLFQTWVSCLDHQHLEWESLHLEIVPDLDFLAGSRQAWKGIIAHGDHSRHGFHTWITTDLEWESLHVEIIPDMDFTPG